MQRAYVELTCPDCGKHWEVSPSDMPAPDVTYECPDCRGRSPVSEFAKDKRDLEIIREFH